MNINHEPYRRVGHFVRILRNVIWYWRLFKIKVVAAGKFRHGTNVTLGANAKILAPERMFIGNNVAIGGNLFVQTNVEIGDGCLISSAVAFVSNDHRIDGIAEGELFFGGRLPSQTVTLEGDNLIGYGVIFVGNVRIGQGAVIGAGSVVVKDVPGNTVSAGVPCRFIRMRNLKG